MAQIHKTLRGCGQRSKLPKQSAASRSALAIEEEEEDEEKE